MKNNITKPKSAYIYMGLTVVAAVLIASILFGYYNNTASSSLTQSNMLAAKDNTIGTLSTSNQQAAAQPVPESTGNMTVYIIATPKGIDPAAAIANMKGAISFYDSIVWPTVGVSPRGQATYQQVEITSDNDSSGFPKGEKVLREVVVKPPETVKFYIDPDIKKADGSQVTIGDFRENYSFGSRFSCCGVGLKDDTRINAIQFAFDQAYDSQMTKELPNIKSALNDTVEFTGAYQFSGGYKSR